MMHHWPLLTPHCLVSNREGLGTSWFIVWDKRHETHVVGKSILKLATSSSLVFIGPILNEIQPFKNFKIY